MKKRVVVVLFAVASACGEDDSPQTDETGTGSSSTGEPEGSSSGDPTAVDGSTTSSGAPADTSSSEGGSTTTSGEELGRVEQILADLGVAMYECPDRVWPGDVMDNYRSRQVLLASVEQNAGWLWNDQAAREGDPPRVTMGPLDGLPPEWSATFNIGELGGVPTLGISLDETAVLNEMYEAEGLPLYRDFATVLIFHEAFHFLSDQNDWNVNGGSRSTPYPEPWEPRYVRAQLTAALRATLEDGAPLGAAAFWQAVWASDYPDEMDAIRAYDVTEGSAEYASLVSSVLAVEGCDATEDVVLAEAILHLDEPFQSTGFSAGSEPYDLGVLAGLLLRMAEVPGWELEQEDGSPPVEQLLSTIEPVIQPDDAALQADVQDAVDMRNVQVGMEIDPMLEALASPDYHRVVVSLGWVAGSFGLGGFYYLPDEPGAPEVWLTLNALLTPPSGVQIDLMGETSLVGVDTPCALAAGPSIVLTLPVADVAVADGLATSTATTATFTDLAVESTTDLDGLEWLCPVDGGGADAPLPDPAEASPRARPRVVRLGPTGLVALP
jgi:hypothetical protein